MQLATTKDKGIALQLTPRYVLFGGWKASFCVGYNAPLEDFLMRDAVDSELYMLNVSFYDAWYVLLPVANGVFTCAVQETQCGCRRV